jgi:hypothetical protein
MNLNKLAVAAAAIVISTSAQSTTESLTFSGTVASTCSFIATQNGVLVSSAALPYVLTTNVNSGGTPGAVTIGFNSTPTLSFSRINGFTTSPDLSLITSPTYTTEVSSTLGPWTPNGSSFTRTYSAGTSDEITINFQASTGDNNKPWPIGQYLAGVTITCQ